MLVIGGNLNETRSIRTEREKEGWTFIDFDLNKGAGGEYIYMHVVKTATDDPLLVHNEAELNEAVTLCANIRVVENITLTNVVDVYYPVTFSLDLYGHTIDRNLTASAGGNRLNAKQGIHAPESTTLNFWGQELNSGHLVANSDRKKHVAGIGENRKNHGNDSGFHGTINIHGATVENGVLTLTFGEAVKSIQAGIPYIVKWDSGEDIVDPVFKMVKVTNTPVPVQYGGVTFTGTFSPEGIYDTGQTVLYLGADNKLYKATRSLNINSFRGYFVLDASIQTRSVTRCELNTGEKE